MGNHPISFLIAFFHQIVVKNKFTLKLVNKSLIILLKGLTVQLFVMVKLPLEKHIHVLEKI